MLAHVTTPISYRKASFSRSFRTSFWLFSFATSIGVFPSRFCRVLEQQVGGEESRRRMQINNLWIATEYRKTSILLTQRHRAPTEVRHNLSCHSQLHSEVPCSCSCPEHPRRLQLQGVPERTWPAIAMNSHLRWGQLGYFAEYWHLTHTHRFSKKSS